MADEIIRRSHNADPFITLRDTEDDVQVNKTLAINDGSNNIFDVGTYLTNTREEGPQWNFDNVVGVTIPTTQLSDAPDGNSFRTNNANLDNVTELYVSEFSGEESGSRWDEVLQRFDTNQFIYLQEVDRPGRNILFQVNGTVVRTAVAQDPSGLRDFFTIPVTRIRSQEIAGGAFPDGNKIRFRWWNLPTSMAGRPGPQLPAGSPFVLRSTRVDLGDTDHLALSLRNETVNAGYAYRVSLGGTYFGGTVPTGSVIVALTDNPDLTPSSTDWVVIDDSTPFTIGGRAARFLEQVTEVEERVNVIRVDSAGEAADALIWLTPAPFVEQPFLVPSNDTGGAPNGNPRPGQTVTYVGGREDQDANADYTFAFSRFNTYMYLGITPSYATGGHASDIRVQILNLDDEVIETLSLADDFVNISSLNNSTVRNYAYSTDGINPGQLNYQQGWKIQVWRTSPRNHYRLDTVTVDVTPNVDDIDENQLDLTTRAKLNGDVALPFAEKEKLDNIAQTTTSAAFSGETMHYRFDHASDDILNYTSFNSDNGVPPSATADRTLWMVTDNSITITAIAGSVSGTATFVEQVPSLIVGKKMWKVTMPASSDTSNFFIPTGTKLTTTLLDLSDLYRVDRNNFSTTFLNEILNTGSTHDEDLPEALRALNNQADVRFITHSNYRSNNGHVYLNNTFAMLKNAPTVFPNVAGGVINEIAGSNTDPVDPDPLTSVQDVGALTGNVMTGAGLVSDELDLICNDGLNFRLNFGCWMYYESLPTSYTPILQVRERFVGGGHPYRDLIGMGPNGLTFKQRNTTGETQNSSARQPLTSVNGLPLEVLTGTGSQSTKFRVYTAGTWFIQIERRLVSTQASQGGEAHNYVITDIDVDQGETTQVFDVGGNQTVKLSFTSDADLYGPDFHTINVEVDTILGNESSAVYQLDIDILDVSLTVPTTRNNTYTDQLLLSDGHAQAGRLMRMIVSLRAVNGSGLQNLEADVTFFGYDDNGNARVFDENTISFNYIALDLLWDRLRFGGTPPQVSGSTPDAILQNIQGMFLNHDTPLIEYPRHSTLNNWLSHYDNKANQWVWGNVHGPDQDTEIVYFPEFVNFGNLVLVSPNGTKYKLAIDDDGSLKPEVVT